MPKEGSFLPSLGVPLAVVVGAGRGYGESEGRGPGRLRSEQRFAGLHQRVSPDTDG